ncbi:sigma-54-dependent Fis family transcriptional regulator [Putridiphycobacter roseus]|uniref:Sigma-54-dependent Fis family transcriptional regulator n=1 Tax=Putridiphycobacter roseus TaxID=2219161 RepID=A0A2W1NCK8_9FLAO|nr:sigma-54 dependent transcriptional regulator [Putridiphycobacter roseus]PZE15856.1 sigma-54-dependent Fis family transcriptional regulator [Putridiphycobacter roseus]
MQSILIVDDDITFLKILEKFLTRKGFEITCCSSVIEAIKTLTTKPFDLLLLDYKLNDGIGLDIISKANELELKTVSIIMTRFDDVKLAVKSIKKGAFDYITKPINHEELLMMIDLALSKDKAEINHSKTIEGQEFLLGTSAPSKKVTEQIELIAPTELTVIIEGESGTGKEHTARKIHNLSQRKNQPFIAIDCGTLSKELAGSELFGHKKGSFTGAESDKVGKFKTADKGTIFLDEIGNLSYDVQVKLLRVIQERCIQPVGSNETIQIDVRIIVATNENLKELSLEKKFREDLYFRLDEFKIELPALRERKDEIPLFIDYFLQQSNQRLGKAVAHFSEELVSALQNYYWPGNIRELKNIINRVVLLSKSKIAQIDVLPLEMLSNKDSDLEKNETDLKLIQEHNEKALIERTLVQTKNNKSLTANLLNIDRSTLYLKIKKYGIET